MRCRIAMLGVGVDFMTNPPDRQATRLLVEADTAYWSVRDRPSAAALADIGVAPGRFHLGADAAFALRAELPARTPPQQDKPLSAATVGVSLRPLFKNPRERGDDKPRRAANYRLACAELVRGLVERAAKVVLIPFSSEDVRFLADLAAATGAEARPFQADPREVLRLLSGLDAMVAMRYHALILSILAGTPAVPLPYSPKVLSLAEELGFGTGPLVVGDGTEMPDQPLNAPAALAAVEALWPTRPAVIAQYASFAAEKRRAALDDMVRCWTALGLSGRRDSF
jgi:polysaccharide pyruvyl transferase WcaK-like protein